MSVWHYRGHRYVCVQTLTRGQDLQYIYIDHECEYEEWESKRRHTQKKRERRNGCKAYYQKMMDRGQRTESGQKKQSRETKEQETDERRGENVTREEMR